MKEFNGFLVKKACVVFAVQGQFDARFFGNEAQIEKSGVGSDRLHRAREIIGPKDVARIILQQETNIRSEEHTSELQSLTNLVCRLLLEKKKAKNQNDIKDQIDSETCGTREYRTHRR